MTDGATTIYLAGDSTVESYPARRHPLAGWGQALPQFLSDGVSVVNLSRSGCSSKTFVAQGWLGRILGRIRPGDHLLIQFGHNDAKDDERRTEPYSSFQANLSLYVDGARRRGAIPVLVTPMQRRSFDARGRIIPGHGDFPPAMRQLAQMKGVPLIDLATMSIPLYEEWGVEGSKERFLWVRPGVSSDYPDGVCDNTHFQVRGAVELARIVADQLRLRELLPRRCFAAPTQGHEVAVGRRSRVPRSSQTN